MLVTPGLISQWIKSFFTALNICRPRRFFVACSSKPKDWFCWTQIKCDLVLCQRFMFLFFFLFNLDVIFFVADIDGLGLDVPPGSPSSVRSSGDGSSCDTPPVNQCTSSTDDGRTDRGKYCDCCYCEFFGHAAVSRLFTSNQVTLFDFCVHVLKSRDGLRAGQNIFVSVWNEWIGKVDQIVPQTYF